MQFWHALRRALTGTHDVSASDAIPDDTEQTIRFLRGHRWAADQQIRMLRQMNRDPDSFPLTRSLRPNMHHDS